MKVLAGKVFQKNERGEVTTSRDFVGKNATVLARAAGLSISR